jgi:hypothetical protein
MAVEALEAGIAVLKRERGTERRNATERINLRKPGPLKSQTHYICDSPLLFSFLTFFLHRFFPGPFLL